MLLLGTAILGQETEVISLDELLTTFNWDSDATEITTRQLSEGLYVLFGAEGNVAVSIGERGVLAVVDVFPEVISKVNKVIDELGGGPIDFAVNTHRHFDHAHGNLALGSAGSWIVERPMISFRDSMTFHFNGNRIDFVHHARAHTGGDAVVIFRDQNAVHFLDVNVNAGYPFNDFYSGVGSTA